MNTTLSVVSPDKAAQIRSAVTGALRKDQSGLLHFEQTVETTFLLPWDLNPQVSPVPPTHPHHMYITCTAMHVNRCSRRS